MRHPFCVDRSILVRPPRRFTHKRNKFVISQHYLLWQVENFYFSDNYINCILFYLIADIFSPLLTTKTHDVHLFHHKPGFRLAPIWLHKSSSVKLLPEGVECIQRRSSVDELYKQQVTTLSAVTEQYSDFYFMLATIELLLYVGGSCVKIFRQIAL